MPGGVPTEPASGKRILWPPLWEVKPRGTAGARRRRPPPGHAPRLQKGLWVPGGDRGAWPAPSRWMSEDWAISRTKPSALSGVRLPHPTREELPAQLGARTRPVPDPERRAQRTGSPGRSQHLWALRWTPPSPYSVLPKVLDPGAAPSPSLLTCSWLPRPSLSELLPQAPRAAPVRPSSPAAA